MRCEATLTTATETDEVMAHLVPMSNSRKDYWNAMIPDGVAFIRRGDRLVRLDTDCPEKGGPHSCDKDAEHNDSDHYGEAQHVCYGCGVFWVDEWHGATPHREDDR